MRFQTPVLIRRPEGKRLQTGADSVCVEPMSSPAGWVDPLFAAAQFGERPNMGSLAPTGVRLDCLGQTSIQIITQSASKTGEQGPGQRTFDEIPAKPLCPGHGQG
ncbi:MAG: hypothetical protein C7B43_07380 [Sulfobacillus benefaciens]|uniref:Uncharacterized protein n=1 Tax=Sulfobacillus benefaciens TaxID=453960 RepID=A0A2T2X6G2_9FIRM|nr:MAG: hypothetical protein C7B43_07380 [Sulfobacillus benefaciens]